MLTIAIILLRTPSIAFAQFDARMKSASSRPLRRHRRHLSRARFRRMMLPVALRKVLVETTMALLTKVAEVMKTVEMAAMSRIGAF